MSGTYVPNPADPTQPVEAVIAGTAAAEFRGLKQRVNDVTASASLSNGSGLQNILINGDFGINALQGTNEYTPPATPTLQYVTDMWNINTVAAGAGSMSAQTFVEQIDGPPGYTTYQRYRVKVVFPSTAAGQFYEICSYVEGANFRHMNFGGAAARASTILFFCRCSVANQTLAATLRNATATRSYVMPFTTGAANTWQRFAFNIPGDITGSWLSGITEAAQVTFTLSSAIDFKTATPNTWLAGNRIAGNTQSNFTGNVVGSTVDFTGVEWRPGTYNVSNPIEIVPLALTDFLARRYYYIDSFAGNAGDTVWISPPTPMRKNTTPIVNPVIGTTLISQLGRVVGFRINTTGAYSVILDARLDIT